MTGLIVLGLVPLFAAVMFWLRATRERQARTRAEAALQRLREIAADQADARLRFLGIVGHELRSPLTAIMGYQELLADGIYGPLDDNVMEAIRRIGISARQILTLTDGMEELAGRPADRDFDSPPADPAGVLHDSLADATRDAAARNITLDIRIDEQLPLLRVDADRLRNLVDALLYAALKLARGREIHATASALDGALAFVLSGPGLDRHPLPPATPAGAAHRSDTRDPAAAGERDPDGETAAADFPITSGSALRLAIARSMTRALGGTLTSAGSGDHAALELRLPA